MELAKTAKLQLALLGGFEMRRATGEVVDIVAQKDRALLAFLAVTSGDSHSRERLAGMLWSGHGDPQARNSLKQALVRLRRYFEATDQHILWSDRQSIGLDRALLWIDALDFERLVRDDTIGSLAQAIALYRGDLLEGVAIHDLTFEDWLLVERQRLRNLLECALTSLMSQAVGVGDSNMAADAARRSLLLDPLKEAAYRTLMQIHADQGQTAQALKLYESLSERLYRELGVQPESTTAALHDRIRQRRTSPTTPAGPANAGLGPARDAPTAAKPSIAVLPLLDLSGRPEQQYFSDGVTEDIITGLSRFRSLLVIARNSAFQYRDKAVDVRTVARELGVQYVVDGSVRKADDRIRFSARLIDAVTGNHLWAEHYDRELRNLFAVQDEVTQTIVATIEGRVAAGAAARARRKPTEHMDAYDYVLQARDQMARYELAAAEPLLARAIAADPSYAEAYARHAFIFMFRYWADHDANHVNEARLLARKALALDADDEWAHFAMASVCLSSRQFDLSGSHYERVLALNPNNVTGATMFAEWLTYVGRLDEALQCLDHTMRRDPFPPSWFWEIRGTTLFQLRRYEDAIGAFSNMTTLHPWNHAYLTAAYAHAARLADASHQLALYDAEGPGRSLVDIAAAEPYRDSKLTHHLVEGLQKAASAAGASNQSRP